MGGAHWVLSTCCAAAALLLAGELHALAKEPEPFEEWLRRTLMCREAPDPTLPLLYLLKRHRIDIDKPTVSADSERCWAVSPDVVLGGISFSHICGSNPDPIAIDVFPKLYWRGPGTSPGTGIRLVTEAPLSALSTWAKDYLGSGSNAYVGKSYFIEGSNEIGCSTYEVPGHGARE